MGDDLPIGRRQTVRYDEFTDCLVFASQTDLDRWTGIWIERKYWPTVQSCMPPRGQIACRVCGKLEPHEHFVDRKGNVKP
jgi:hypothetical protein